jgi:hypothetical protein
MSLLGDVITVEQLAAAAAEDFKALYDAVMIEFQKRDKAAATQAAVAAIEVAVDVNEDLKFPRGAG